MAVLFAFTLFLSATLLFFVQPMFAKMILPRLGGTPAVWNTCVVFFQMALLAGYLYAHATTKWLGVRRQALVHMAVLLLPFVFLPISLGRQWAPGPDDNPVAWLTLAMTAVVAVPFFVVSTTAPVLQRWFSRTTHRHATDPFFLYVASNLGSLGALVAYPLVVEPTLTLGQQSLAWTIGYALFTVCTGLCAWQLWRSPERAASPAAASTSSPAWRTRLLWMALAAVASSLMLSVTTYISTDVAAVPLLWIIPLGLYLLSFVLVFARRPIPLRFTNALLPLAVLLPAATMVLRHTPPLWSIQLHLLAFFVAALVLHGRLAASRPSSDHLTDFYLWLSIGGAIGGLFNVLVAPMVFVTTLEYPIGLVAACLLRVPRAAKESSGTARIPRFVRDWLIPTGIPVAAFGLALALGDSASRIDADASDLTVLARTYAIPFGLCLLLWVRPISFALSFGAVLLAFNVHVWTHTHPLYSVRTFFGRHDVATGLGTRVLIHGTTTHGSQFTAIDRKCEPTTYYTRSSPIGQLFASFTGPQEKHHIGVIGLGAGTMASYATPSQSWTFFEINPAVVRLSTGGQYFTYIKDCAPQSTVVVGDARLSLERAQDAAFDVLVFDAFSSDAVPVHLMTLEALTMYLTKLAPGGVLAFHISNRHLDLSPVFGRLADRLSMAGMIEVDSDVSDEALMQGKFASTWVVLARNRDDFGTLLRDSRWQTLIAPANAPLWTDDFSNIVRVLK